MSATFEYAGGTWQHCCEHRSSDHRDGQCHAAVGIARCTCTAPDAREEDMPDGI